MKKLLTKRILGLLLCLAVLAALLPLANISAQLNGEQAAAYAFSGTEISVRQMVPFGDEGAAILFNDGSVELWRRHPDTGETLKSPVSGLTGAVKLIDENRALKSDGTVWIWDGVLDDSFSCEAQQVQNLSNVADASGDYYLVATGSQGQYNVRTLDRDTEGAEPVTLFSVTGAEKIVANGSDGGLILKEDGTVWSFGSNVDGQLGIGSSCAVPEDQHYKSSSCTCSKTPVQLKNETGKGFLTGIADIAPGVALGSNGAVYAWGNNASGRLGDGSYCDVSYDQHFESADCHCSSLPQKVPGLSGVTAVAATGGKVYAVTSAGALYQWGEKDPSSASEAYARILSPAAVDGISDVSAVFAGSGVYQTAYLQRKDGAIWLLGFDALGEPQFNPSPKAQAALAPQKAVTALSRNLSASHTITEGEALPSMPAGVALTGTAAGGNVSLTVKGWECETGFNASRAGVYRFRPIFESMPSGYRIVDEILPRITVTVKAREVTEIALVSKPGKTSYVVGQELDLSGAKLRVSYSNGTAEEISVTSAMVSGYDKNKTGTQTVTITYSGKTAAFQVTVAARAVTGITLSSYPSKLSYSVGENLDVSGGRITAAYNDGTTQTVTLTASMVTGYNKDKTGAQTLTVTYSGKTTTFQVSVAPRSITSSVYSVNTQSNRISKIPTGTAVADFKAKLSASGGTIQVYKGSSQVTSGYIGTGMTVRLVYDGKTVQTLTAIVTGDITGDGLANITDLVNVQSVILKKKTLTATEQLAGDINGDGKVNITDLVNIQSHILRKKLITPRAV